MQTEKSLRPALLLIAALILAQTGPVAAADKLHLGPALDEKARPLKAIPDEKTAILVAEAVLGPIYSDAQVRRERPFHASLDHGVWNVDGTLNCGPNCLGGTAHVSIAQKDGRILNIFHGK
jgi:hypothetical protein